MYIITNCRGLDSGDIFIVHLNDCAIVCNYFYGVLYSSGPFMYVIEH